MGKETPIQKEHSQQDLLYLKFKYTKLLNNNTLKSLLSKASPSKLSGLESLYEIFGFGFNCAIYNCEKIEISITQIK